MAQTWGKRYIGSASGQTATFEAALQNALTSAAKSEKTNHFSWELAGVHGDIGGVVGKNVSVEIVIRK